MMEICLVLLLFIINIGTTHDPPVHLKILSSFKSFLDLDMGHMALKDPVHSLPKAEQQNF
jgi:hypothetical protein